jgi:hypothetical protein
LTIDPHRCKTIWLGKKISTDLKPDYQIKNLSEAVTEAEKVENQLIEDSIILKNK